jgi:murein DD-endopeptidase MepM/ murein hydrolase activator NlpD
MLTSFNAVLTAFALGGSMIIISKKTLPLLLMTIFFIIIFTLFFQNILSEKLLPVLVLPFNVVTLSTIYSLKFRRESTDLTLLYFTPGSPEENYYYHTSRVARFEGFKYLFPELPFHGEWKVTQAFDGEFTHKDEWRYAWDFEIADEKGCFHDGTGTQREDYYCYNTIVVAPLDGKVVRVVDGIYDNEIGAVNLEQNWGNTVIIDHGQGLFSSLSHLKNKSISVKEGDEVKKGQIIARCGNSGRSPRPHLHFQFQLTDKLGDKTYKFPISQYIAENENGEQLRVFDYPKQNQTVKNIDVHKSVKEAFTFKLGDDLIWQCEYGGKSFEEEWKVKVDMLNVLYIENSNGDRLNIYQPGKIFYASSYVGSKKSALYFFYLSASKVPLGYSSKLVWEDVYPLSSAPVSLMRYVTEPLLLFTETLEARGKFNWFKTETNVLNLISKLEISGKGLFSFYAKEGYGKITINNETGLTEFSYTYDEKTFNAKIKKGDT